MKNQTRRDFLKLAAASAAVPAALNTLSVSAAGRNHGSVPLLPEPGSYARSDIPTVESLRSVTMTHRFGDLFNPPGLTNQWGCAQAAIDVTGIRSIAFPPFAQGEMNTAALGSGGELLTGVLYIDGEYFASSRELIEFTWQPDRIERKAIYKGLELKSTTIVPFGQMSVAVRLTVSNMQKARRRTEIKLALQGGASKSVTPWNAAYSPGEFDNERTIDAGRGAVIFKSRHSDAFAVQGASPHADQVLPSWLVYQFDLGPAESKTITFVNSLGQNLAEATSNFDSLIGDFSAAASRTSDEWNAQFKAAFTPGNDNFSGYLPVLVTDDDDVRRIYHSAVLSALYFRRTTPHSVYGTTYVTLAPRYWETTTFLWDISLSAMLLAILDPKILKRMIETWMQLDVYQHFGTEYLTGAGIGPWYSVNDFAMCRMAREYLRWTGDLGWLDTQVGGQTVIERLVTYAEHWRALDTNKHGLADYGGVSNLLEAVSSYVHEVAGLNAANVYNLKFVAELLEHRGQSQRAATLRADADTLTRHVIELYVPGKGIWHCRLPDGTMNEVRHCYDFGTVLITIGDSLSDQIKKEMVRFFREELQTPAWMRALSTRDLDVTFSIRPDHQWTGAYTAWPALALGALYKAGAGDVAFAWIKGIAKTTMQGPIAQAHFAETAVSPEAGGGARKAPSDQPYINDWACVSGCAYLEPLMESIFGVHAGLFGKIEATSNFGAFDASAELRGLNYQGKRYTASRTGVREMS